ncbi:lipopolysaccharide biosynthesis protein, partial [Clostridium perfringens]
YYIIINIYISRKYPWLNKDKEDLDYNTKMGLFKNIWALFMHKIGGVVVNSTDNIVISKFVGLGILANYANYNTVIAALQKVILLGLNGITASVGNMLNSSDKKKAYDIHKKIFFLNFWIVSFVVISLYNTLNQFVGLWVGKQYLLDSLTFIVILINLYFVTMRGSVEQFQNGSGNFYQDRYAPLVEAFINLAVSIFLVKKIGIAGVFIGTLVSNFTVIFWTKPYIVYK